MRRDDVSISVIVPTYREAENLPVLVPRIAAALASAGLHGEIIIVDDNSLDNTVNVCAELAGRYPLQLIVRTTERGLSSAVLAGMRRATGEILVVMDADLSHPPEAIPALVQSLQQGADFVIGSRYVAGSRVAEGWGALRWLNSKVATLLARPLTRAADPMAGFFALRRSRFEQAESLDPIGYKIGLELIVQCGCQEVREVPITFANRLHGSSKLTLREQLNYLRHLKRLYLFKYRRRARPVLFGLVGLSGVPVDLLTLSLLLNFLPLSAARAFSIWTAMTWNFCLNRQLTFADRRAGRLRWQYPMYLVSCALGAVVSWSATLLLSATSPVLRDSPLLAALAGIVLGAAVNYVLCSQAVFRVPHSLRLEKTLAGRKAAAVPTGPQSN